MKKVQLCRPITEELINSLRVPPNTNSIIQSLSQIVSDDVDMDESCFPDIDDEKDTFGDFETAVEADDMDSINLKMDECVDTFSMDCADHDKSFDIGSTWSCAKKLKSSLIKKCSRTSK